MSFSSSFPSRPRLSGIVLLVLPLLVYASGILERYGFRDDYSTLREAREGGEIIFQVNASHGRPVYGWLLEHSFAMLTGIDALHWARLVSALLAGVLSLLAAWSLHVQLRWSQAAAWLVGGLLALLPATQIYIHWAICWPIVLAAVLGLAAFISAEWGYRQASRTRRMLGAAGAFVLLFVALLDYQPNALLCVVLIAAGWIARLPEPAGIKARWAAWHVGLVVLALAAGFVASKTMFAFSSVERSPRFSVEADWWGKLGWSADHALRNALAMEVLDDNLGRTEPWHKLAAAASGTAIILFGAYVRRKQGWATAWGWWVGFLALALLAYAVSFVAAERWATYRTLLPLSGVVVVFLVHAFTTTLGPGRRTTVIFCSMLGGTALLAHHDSHEYLAKEQEAELALVETAARKVDPETMPRIALLLPPSENSSAPLRYLDEYGSMSTDADWCAKEMMLLILQERLPGESPAIARLQVSGQSEQPVPGTYDVLIDLRPGDGSAATRNEAQP